MRTAFDPRFLDVSRLLPDWAAGSPFEADETTPDETSCDESGDLRSSRSHWVTWRWSNPVRQWRRSPRTSIASAEPTGRLVH